MNFSMGFLRYIILLGIVTGSTSIGFIISRKYLDRVKELIDISNFINMLQNKIKFTHKPLTDLLEELSKVEENSIICQILKKASEKLKTKKTETAWKEAIREERFFLNLTNEDINLIESLGNVLGKTDIEGQMSEINQFQVILKNQIKKAEQECNKNEKMYKSLGTVVGFALAIIFI